MPCFENDKEIGRKSKCNCTQNSQPWFNTKYDEENIEPKQVHEYDANGMGKKQANGTVYILH